MNVQPNVAVPVNQTPARDGYRKKGRTLLAGAVAAAGFYVGGSAAECAGNGACRKVFENPLLQPFMIKSEFAPVLGTITGYFVGEGVYHGLGALEKGSRMIKVCASIGAVWSMLAGRELMYSLVDINPLPDSYPWQLIVGGSNEWFNDCTLAVLGAGTGYLAGKGLEYVAHKAYEGVGMAARGVASLAAMAARQDVMVEPG